jgi:hypothetical protein
VCLEVRLAHAIKVTLCLLGTAIGAALARLSTVALAQTLRLDDACASIGTTVSPLVFENSSSSVAHDGVGDLGGHCSVVYFADRLMQERVERLLLVMGEESKRLKAN